MWPFPIWICSLRRQSLIILVGALLCGHYRRDGGLGAKLLDVFFISGRILLMISFCEIYRTQGALSFLIDQLIFVSVVFSVRLDRMDFSRHHHIKFILGVTFSPIFLEEYFVTLLAILFFLSIASHSRGCPLTRCVG